jgi:cystathionine beta-lyase
MINTPDRRNTDSIKWGVFDEDVLPLWIADMDFSSPPEVIDALKRRVEHGVFGYGLESSTLKDLLIERMDARYHWKISRDDILFIPGVISGFNVVSQAVVQPGQSILIQTPVYPPFFTVPQNAGAKSVFNEIKLNVDGKYGVDLNTFEKSITADTRCFMLCNPHNPIGRVYTQEELSGMAEICLRHDVVICADEIHCDLVYSGHKHLPIASIDPEIAAHTVTLMAPSKTYNIPGLACSILICTNPELRQRIENARRGLLGWVNIMGMTAAEAAYRDGDLWLREVLGLLESNRDFLYDYLKKNIPQIKMVKPEATYLAWLDCRDLNLPLTPQKFFLERARVALNDGADFGEPGRGYVRLNFACSRYTLTIALERMVHAIQSL